MSLTSSPACLPTNSTCGTVQAIRVLPLPNGQTAVYVQYKGQTNWVRLNLNTVTPSLQDVSAVDPNIVKPASSFENAHFYLRAGDALNTTTGFYTNTDGGGIQAGNTAGPAPLHLQPEGGLLTYNGHEVATTDMIPDTPDLQQVTDVGDTTTNSLVVEQMTLTNETDQKHDGALSIERTLDDSGGPINARGIRDSTTFSRTGRGYAAFDARLTLGGNIDHHVAFQAMPFLNGHAKASEIEGFLFRLWSHHPLDWTPGDVGAIEAITIESTQVSPINGRRNIADTSYAIKIGGRRDQDGLGSSNPFSLWSNGSDKMFHWGDAGFGVLAQPGFKLSVLGNTNLDGTVTSSSLSGSGTRMVIATPSGELAAQPIPAETDPTVPSYVKQITTTEISNWNTAFSWGNHATAGYEAQSNKVTTLMGANNTTYPTTQAVSNALSTAVANYVPLSQKGVANGVATLGADGKLPNSQIPAIAISETFVVNSQTAMLALSAAETGDVAVRTDINKSFILIQGPPSTLANWQELLTPTAPATNLSLGAATGTTRAINNSNGTGVTLPAATTSLAGLMTSADKTKLNGLDGSLYVPTSRTITAGNGLTGGGDLSANRTFTMGTPSPITSTSTNGVTATSHTHELANQAVTNTKFRNSAGLSIVGRSASTAGSVADITAGTDGHVLRRSGSTIGFGTIGNSSISDLAWSKITGTPAIPAQLNPTAGTGMSITGTYPNLTFTNTAPNVPSNLALGTANATTRAITNSNGTGVTLPSVTTTIAGLMPAADKAKLNSIEAGAEVNAPPQDLQSVTDEGNVTTDSLIVSGTGDYSKFNTYIGYNTVSIVSDQPVPNVTPRTAGFILEENFGSSAPFIQRITFGMNNHFAVGSDPYGGSTYGFLTSNAYNGTTHPDLLFFNRMVGINWNVLGGYGGPLYNLDVKGNTRISDLPDSTGDFVTAAPDGALGRRAASEVLSDIGAVPASRTITAGNGLTGGGDLSANRTITMGTPSPITSTSTNGVTATSHTHELANQAVTNAKFRNSAGLSIVGRSASTAGSVADITAGTDGHVLRRSGSTIGFGTIGNSSISDIAWGKVTGTPAIPAPANNGLLSLSATGIASGSASFTANQSGNSSFTVNVPGTNVGLGTLTGQITSSTGSGTRLPTLYNPPVGVADGAFDVKDRGLYAYATATTNTGFPSNTFGGGLTFIRNPNNNSGRFDLHNYNGSTDLWFSAGGSAWDRVAGKDWIEGQLENYITTNTTQSGLTGQKSWESRHLFLQGVAVGKGTQYALTAFNDGSGSYSTVSESTLPMAFDQRAISYDFAASGNFPSSPGFNHIQTIKLWSGGNKAWQWVYPYTSGVGDAPLFRSSVNNGSAWNAFQTVASREWVQEQLTPETDPVYTASIPHQLMYKALIGNAEDLNDYTTTGIYHQSYTSQAASGTNYPTAQAGKLEVVNGANFIYQTYTTLGSNNTVYTRGRYSGTWYPWKKLASTNDIPTLQQVTDAGNTSSNNISFNIASGSIVKNGSSGVPTGDVIIYKNSQNDLGTSRIKGFNSFGSNYGSGWHFNTHNTTPNGAAGEVLALTLLPNGTARFPTLSGTGNRMVVANANGDLTTQPILTYSGSTSVTVSGGTISRAALVGDVIAPANSNTTTIANNAVTTAKIANNAVTFAKMEDLDAGTLIGRYSATDGDPQQVKVGTGLALNAGSGELRATGEGIWEDELGYGYEGNANDDTRGIDTRGGYASRTHVFTSSDSIPDDVETVIFLGTSVASLTLPNPANFPSRVIEIVNQGGVQFTLTGYPPAMNLFSNLAVLAIYPSFVANTDPFTITIKSVYVPSSSSYFWLVTGYNRQ